MVSRVCLANGIYIVSQKNKTLNSCPKLPQMLTDFHNYFTVRLTGKFGTQSYLNILPHLKYVAALPCEVCMSENWQQSEVCIAINDKSQDSTTKHLSCDGLLHYKFIIQFVH